MVDMAQREAAQRRHDETRARQYEEERPRPTHELYELRALAEKAKTDASAMLEFATVCTPQTFLMAFAAERFDDQHPWYSCVHCHDGERLPEGYECQVCGADNPRPGSY